MDEEQGRLDLFRQLDGQVRRMHDQSASLQETLDVVVSQVVTDVPGTEHASLSQTAGRQTIVSLATSDHVASDLDTAQNQAGQGPCVDALYDHETVLVHDWEDEDRWPAVRPRYLAIGIRSTLCFRLYLAHEELGSLNLLSSYPDAFDGGSVIVAEHFATHAALALRRAAYYDQMQVAIDRRDVIGQAKGILMTRLGVTADMAFGVLVRHSRDTNTKLHTVAEMVAETGALPSSSEDQTT